jgi:hypothetical protein
LGSFSGKLYNGTEWVVKDVLFEVSANPGEPDELAKFIFEPSQKVAVGENTVPSEWTRKLKASFHLEPYTTEEFSRKVPEQEARVNWSIVEAHGYRP